MNVEFQRVLDKLYCRFYKSRDTFSEVTSSHWRDVGWHKASLGEGKWKLKGAGFGDWKRDSLINRMRTISVSHAVDELRSNYACQDELWRLGMAVAKSQNRLFNYDCAKQVLSLAKVARSIGATDPSSPLESVGIKRGCASLAMVTATLDPC